MNKNIKKSLKFLIIIIGIIFFLPTLLFIALRIHPIQNFVARRITNHLSNEIKSTIAFGKIEYDFFNTLIITDLLIKDQSNDTLIYSKELDINIRKISLISGSFRFGKVVLEKPVISLVTDSAGKMNLSWYLQMLRLPDDSLKESKIRLIIDEINVNEGRFSFVNVGGKKGKAPFNINNLKVSELNGQVEDFIFQGDSTAFEIYNIGFKESSGLLVKKMNSNVVISKQSLKFNSLQINSSESVLSLLLVELRPDPINNFRNFTEEVRLDVVFERSDISTSELKYFVPLSREIEEEISISGRIFGTVEELRGRNINFFYGDHTDLNCDFDITGLTDIDNAFIFIDVSSLNTNAGDIEKLDISEKGKIRLPPFVYEMGNISFAGSFTGFTTDFVTYGKLATRLGNVRMDLSLRPEQSRFRIRGLINGSNIDLGSISDRRGLLGKLSMEAHIDGHASSLENFATNLTGKIDSIEINSYTYRNIALNGFFTEKMWDGNINVEEENIKMELLGMFNFREELPEFDFSLNLREANLHKLNFDPKDSTSRLTMLLTSNFVGNNIDNLDGEIKLINSTIKKYGNALELKGFSIKAHKDNGKPALSLTTDFADADIKGYYSFSGLSDMVKLTLAGLVPSVYEIPVTEDRNETNNFTFNINFKNTEQINNFFKTGLLFSENSYINGIISADSIMTLNGKSASFSAGNNVFNDLTINAYVSKSSLSADISTSSLEFMGQTNLKEFMINLDARPDNFNFLLGWDNKEKVLNKGTFSAHGTFSKSVIENGNPLLKVRIDSSDVYVRNNLWKINESGIVIDSNTVIINNVFIANNSYYYQIDGSVSEDPRDTLSLSFQGIDISPLNYITKKTKPESAGLIPLNISGRLNGNILVNDVYENPVVQGNILINDLSLLGDIYGNMSINSEWNTRKRVINLDANSNLNGATILDVEGYYDPSSKEIDLDVIADKLPIGALNPLLKVFASGISGFATGEVKLSGMLNKLDLTGSILAQDASVKIDYLQTVYRLNDRINFDKEGILFNNVRLNDVNGNTATLNGYVHHKNLKDYQADLVVTMNRSMVINTRPKDNELFYGTGFASGKTNIRTSPAVLSFDISASTEKNTKFFIPLNSGSTIADYSFITFIDPNKPDTLQLKGAKVPEVARQTGIDLNIDLEITPDAEVKLIFDEKVGDEMTGTGSGDLNINLDRKGIFRISGDYIIEKGDYLFTLGNILNKPFEVESGGRITFNGEIENAEIDLNAVYELKTSLREILQDDRYKERTDVECHLNLTGNLFNPAVRLNIELPNADEETRTYLKSMITTEEELNRQFFSLLAMNSFMATNTSSSGTSAMAVTTFEMLSNQFSNMLSQISNDFDIGINYRPGNQNINSQELEVALSTQLLDDKVLVNIRGTSSTQENTSAISGDFDAEIRITEKIRFKVFNRYNNPAYTGRLSDYTQGIGIFYRQEFDRFMNLFRKNNKSDLKKEEETVLME